MLFGHFAHDSSPGQRFSTLMFENSRVRGGESEEKLSEIDEDWGSIVIQF